MEVCAGSVVKHKDVRLRKKSGDTKKNTQRRVLISSWQREKSPVSSYRPLYLWFFLCPSREWHPLGLRIRESDQSPGQCRRSILFVLRRPRKALQGPNILRTAPSIRCRGPLVRLRPSDDKSFVSDSFHKAHSGRLRRRTSAKRER